MHRFSRFVPFACLAAIALACWALGASAIGASPAAVAPARRPNFLVLLTDDQRADCLSCAGHPVLETPHIDALAKGGVRFTNAFVTTAICCVSRASLVTGRYARSHRVPDFGTPLPPDVAAVALPTVLHRAGYRTGCFGKWGLGGERPEGMFDVWDAWGGQGEFFHDVAGERVHNSEYLARRTSEFLASQPADQPFCLFAYFKSPHDPYQPDPRDERLFDDVVVPEPATYTDEHFARLPEFIRVSEGRTRALQAHPTRERWQTFAKQYLRCIAGVDRAVGKIMAELEARQLDDNTVVVFVSDNGFFLGERGLSHKWLMYEESIRVPLIVRDPRLPSERRGARSDALALNIDIAPTLLDLAGLAVPAEMDGASLRPLLQGQAATWREDFFYEHHFHYGGKIPRCEGVRTANLKYVRYFNADRPYEELFDLAADPLEERNLAQEPGAGQRLAAMRARYRAYLDTLPPAVIP